MDLQGIAAIAQIAAYVLGVLAAFMGVAALVWMVGKGARRRALFLVILDGVALTMIFGPVVLGWLHAGSLADWLAIFQIAGFVLELIRVALAYAELRVIWPGLAERTRNLPRGLFRMLRWSLRAGLVGAGFALFAVFAAAASSPYDTLHFSAGAIPVESDNCVQVGSGDPRDAGDTLCMPDAAWRLPAGGSIESRAFAPARNGLSRWDAMTYKAGVRDGCAATVRWAGYVNGVQVAGGVVRSGVEATPFEIPAEPRIKEFRVTATRTDTAPCAAEFVLMAPAY